MSNWLYFFFSHGAIGEAGGLSRTNVSWNCDGNLVTPSKVWQKRAKMTIFFGEAFRFDVWVRLNDQYKSECGPWIDSFIHGVHLKRSPNNKWNMIQSTGWLPFLVYTVYTQFISEQTWYKSGLNTKYNTIYVGCPDFPYRVYQHKIIPKKICMISKVCTCQETNDKKQQPT